MIFAKEEFTEKLIGEMAPLWRGHYDEIAKYKDIPLDPDIDVYRSIAASGGLRIFTFRDSAGSLHGYEIFFVKNHPHYKTCLTASQDILYLCPETRKGFMGYKFIEWCDKELRSEGVQLVIQHVKESNNFSSVLRRMGYVDHDRIMTRRLDKGQS